MATPTPTSKQHTNSAPKVFRNLDMICSPFHFGFNIDLIHIRAD